MRRKVLALLLVLTMLVSVAPMAVFAAGEGEGGIGAVAEAAGTEDAAGTKDSAGTEKAAGTEEAAGTDEAASTEDSGEPFCGGVHENGFSPEYEKVEGLEYHNVLCRYCHELVSSEACRNDGTGKCQYCGGTVTTLESDYCECGAGSIAYSAEYVDANYHRCICEKCGKPWRSLSKHFDVSPRDGICDYCNGKMNVDYDTDQPCQHPKENYIDQDGIHTCPECGWQEFHVSNDGDCVCDFPGCSEEAHHFSRKDLGNGKHQLCCLTCGKKLEGAVEEEHYDIFNVDGICDGCGAKMSDDSGDGGSDGDSGNGSTGSGKGYDNVPKTGDMAIAAAGVLLTVFGASAVLVVKKRSV